MPPWLLELLQQQNAAGFADSLSTLVGRPPHYEVLQNAGNRAGQFGLSATQDPTIFLAPSTIKHYAQRGNSAYPGYTAIDRQQKLGDFVLGHEFGHMAASGAGNSQLADQLLDVYPGAQESEQFADAFQNAVQFLRSHSLDASKLSAQSKAIVGVLLQHAPYQDHPINVLNRTIGGARQP